MNYDSIYDVKINFIHWHWALASPSYLREVELKYHFQKILNSFAFLHTPYTKKQLNFY